MDRPHGGGLKEPRRDKRQRTKHDKVHKFFRCDRLQRRPILLSQSCYSSRCAHAAMTFLLVNACAMVSITSAFSFGVPMEILMWFLSRMSSSSKNLMTMLLRLRACLISAPDSGSNDARTKLASDSYTVIPGSAPRLL